MADQKLLFKEMPKPEDDLLSFFYTKPSIDNGLKLVEKLVTRKFPLLDISKKDGQSLIAFLLKTLPNDNEAILKSIRSRIVKREHKYLELAILMSQERKDAKDSLNLDSYWEDTPKQLDIMWMGFSITGKIIYVQRILDALESGRGDTLYRSAMYWSLESNARQHKPVYREILTRALIGQSKNPYLNTLMQRLKF